MNYTFSWAVKLAAVIVCLAMTACGGGGGGGDSGGGGGGGGPGDPATFTIDQTTVVFTGMLGGTTPPSQAVNGTIVGVDSDVHLFVTTTSSGVADATVQLTGANSGALTIVPKSPAAVGAGTFIDTVTVNACLDSACSRPISGSPKTIMMTYTVAPATVTDPDPPGMTVDGSFTVSTNSIAFAAKRGGQLPAAQLIDVMLAHPAGVQVTARFGSNASPPSWLVLSGAGSGDNFTFTLAVNSTSLNAGSYSTTLTISTVAGATILQSRNVQVTYTLRDGLAITDEPLAEQAIAGSSQSTVVDSFTIAGPADVRFTAASNATWLVVPTGILQGPGTYPVTVNTAGLPAGSYRALLTVTNVADSTDTATLEVSLELDPPGFIVAETLPLVLGGTAGLEAGLGTFNVSLTTGTNVHTLSVTTRTADGGDWLSASASSGISGASQSVQVVGDRTRVVAGAVYSGEVVLTATVNGAPTSRTIPVKLNVDRNRLLVNPNGVALSSFPRRTPVLQRSLIVRDTWATTSTPWTAVSNRNWLTVTGSGTTGQALSLTANTAGMAPGTYIATVTVTSSNATIANQEPIRVGLTIGNATPAAAIDIPGVPIFVDDTSRLLEVTAFVANPVEPLVYVGGPTADVISAFDVNTGALISTFTGFTKPKSLAISSDGLVLYVADQVGFSDQIVALSLPSGTRLATYPLATARLDTELDYFRPDARPLVFAITTNEAIDLTTGQSVPLGELASRMLNFSPDLRTAYIQNKGISPSTIAKLAVRYSTLPDTGLLVSYDRQTQGFDDGEVRSNGMDLALSADGSRLYAAAGAPYRVDILTAATLVREGSLPGETFPNNVETCSNGLVAAGPFSGPSVSIYNAANAQIGSVSDAPLRRTLRFSGDCTRLVFGGLDGLRLRAVP